MEGIGRGRGAAGGLGVRGAWDGVAQGGGRNVTIHVVQRGENLFRIAMRYGVTVEAIAQANGITDPRRIYVGQRLIIPGADTSSPGVPVTHVVQPGETLFTIAQLYGTTPGRLAELNHIVNPDSLYVGQVLTVYEENPSGTASIQRGTVHVVQPGETLFRIAMRYGVTVEAIAQANGITNPTLIYAGQQLVIPGGDETPELTADLPWPALSFTVHPLPASQGRAVGLRLQTAVPVELSGTFMDRQIVFFGGDGVYYAVFGVHAMAEPGLYPMMITMNTGSESVTITQSVQVADGGYGYEEIDIPPDRAGLLDPELVRSEAEMVASLMAGYTPTRYFDGPMGLPTAGSVTSMFGTRRSYNGGPYSSFHGGVDFGGGVGAPIYAPAAGVVVFSGQLTVRGNATIIDHGWGVYTGYWHQSETYVQAGQFVSAGQLIGAIGASGLVTGAHLHWELRVGGIQVDPLQWTRESFP